MSSTTAPSGFSEATFAAFLDTRDEPYWLSQARQDAWQLHARQPMPSRRDEEWMRTDIRLFNLDRFVLPETGPATDPVPPSLLTAGVELAGYCTNIQGRPGAADLQKKWIDRGVLFGHLPQLVIEHADRLRPHLMSAVGPQLDKFASLNGAFWTGGACLYVPEGVRVTEPLHYLAGLDRGATDLGRTLIVLEAGAEATVLAETVSHDPHAAGFHCGATEIILGPGARLRYVSLQDWGQGVWHFAHQMAVLQRDAVLQWTSGALGSRLAKVNQHVELTGPGAECQVNGVMFTEAKQHLSYHTRQHHVAPHCRSDFLYKAALQDQSRTVWRGMIKVDPRAQKTDGYQRNDNLLLSADARADAIPGLEIEADDVRCTHGSTTGRVDEELIFYARSRGYTRREAIRMIVSGFFQQVFDRITIDSVRDALGQAIGRRVREYQ